MESLEDPLLGDPFPEALLSSEESEPEAPEMKYTVKTEIEDATSDQEDDFTTFNDIPSLPTSDHYSDSSDEETRKNKDWVRKPYKRKGSTKPRDTNLTKRGRKKRADERKRREVEKRERARNRAKERRANMSAEDRDALRVKWRNEKANERAEAASSVVAASVVDTVVKVENEEFVVMRSGRVSRKPKKLFDNSVEESDSEDYNSKRRKRVSEMTPEEHEKHKATWRRDQEKKKQRYREAGLKLSSRRKRVSEMTPEEHEKHKATWRRDQERKKQRNTKQQKKRVSEMTPEEHEKMKERWRNDHVKKMSRETKTWKKKRVSEMDPEEHEKMKERWRNERKNQREKVKTDMMSGNESVSEVQVKKRKRRTEGLTDEQREALKAKWREEARIKRQRQKERMNTEEREAYLAKQRELTRVRRHGRTDEERAAKLAVAAAQKRARRSLLTPQQKKEESQRTQMRRIVRMSTMTEEEKQAYRIKAYMASVARAASLSSEELERRKIFKTDYQRRRLAAMSSEERERKRIQQRNYRENMSSEKRAKFLENLRNCYRRRVERLKEDPEKWAEVKGKWKESSIRRKAEMRDRGVCTNGVIRTRKRRVVGETELERVARMKEMKRLNQKKRKIKKKIVIQNLLDSGMTMEQIQRQMETKEQRETRLIKARVNKAKNSLRKKLVETGAPVEVINTQLEVLEATYQPPRPAFRAYKPRPDNWKPLTSEDLAFLDQPKVEIVVVQEEVEEEEQKPVKRTPVIIQQPQTNPHQIQLTFQYETTVPVQQQQYGYLYETINTYDIATTTYEATYESVPPPPATPPPSSPPASPPDDDSFVEDQKYDEEVQEVERHPQPVMQQATEGYYIPKNGSTRTYRSRPGPRNGPRGPKKTKKPLLRDVKCDLCGNMYAKNYIQNHKNEHHNPNWVNGRCVICHMEFTVGKLFYRHYRKTHVSGSEANLRGRRVRGAVRGGIFKPDPNNDIVCEICGNSYSKSYITDHRNIHHNTNWTDGKCNECGEEFKSGRSFWHHFRKAHSGRTPEGHEDRKFVCDKCGSAYKCVEYLKHHAYYAHGDGSKVENYVQCQICSKKFKQNITLTAHMRRVHDGTYNCDGRYECMRCHDRLDNSKSLITHVRDKHPDSYFTCQFCGVLKYSAVGLEFHQTRCPKRPKNWVSSQREAGVHVGGVERTPLSCVICFKNVLLFSLTRHFKEVHGVVEDLFSCDTCGKKFKRRDFWVAHIEMIHGVVVSEKISDIQSPNVADRLTVIDAKKIEYELKMNGKSVNLGVRKMVGEAGSSNRSAKRPSTKRAVVAPTRRSSRVVKPNRKWEEESDEEEEEWNSSSSDDDEDVKPDYSNVEAHKRLVIDIVPLSNEELSQVVKQEVVDDDLE